MAVRNLCAHNVLALCTTYNRCSTTHDGKTKVEYECSAAHELHSHSQRRAELFTGGFCAFQW